MNFKDSFLSSSEIKGALRLYVYVFLARQSQWIPISILWGFFRAPDFILPYTKLATIQHIVFLFDNENHVTPDIMLRINSKQTLRKLLFDILNSEDTYINRPTLINIDTFNVHELFWML